MESIHEHPRGHRPHINNLRNGLVSQLAPYAAIILTSILMVLYLLKAFVFEGFLMNRIYGTIYTRLDETARRGFVNHHVAGGIKITLVAATAYAFLKVAFIDAQLQTSYNLHGGVVKMGDILLVCSQIFIAMYVFELFYRVKVSPVSSFHHMGAILIVQSAVTMGVHYAVEPDATIEFVLCFVWGAFDVVAEFLPHVAIILYRIYPENHTFLYRVFRIACFTELVSTFTETVIVMWLFGSLWKRRTLAFKVVTPILHVIFTLAQLWGAIIFHRMAKHQLKLLVDKNDPMSTAEEATVEGHSAA